MPLATLHLVNFNAPASLASFVALIKKTLPKEQQPITLSTVQRWIITPERIDTNPLLKPERPYELLLIIPSAEPLPSSITKHFHNHYHLQVGIPSRLLKNYATSNKALLHPDTSSIPKPTGALNDPIVKDSSQSLTLSPDLQEWVKTFSQTRTGQSAVSMMNLLAFIPERKNDYLKYGAEFAKSIGSKRGGNAKLVGHVVYSDQGSREQSDLAVPTTNLAAEGKESQSPGLEVPATSLAAAGKEDKSSNNNDGGGGGGDDQTGLEVPATILAAKGKQDHSTKTRGDETDLEVPATSLSSSSPSSSSSPPSPSSSPSSSPSPKWDEFALAHYPSITHFADMLASKDYQAVNQKYRVPSLRDTCILCTSEIEVEEVLAAEEAGKPGRKDRAKL